MATGTLKMWNADRGYGFIGNDAGGPDLFLHVSALESAGIDPLTGWRVFIDCPDGNRNYPDNFDNLLSDSKDDRKLPLRHSEIDLGVAV